MAEHVEEPVGESMGTSDVVDDGTGRRDLIKKAAIGGAALWVAPIVLSAPSAAASIPLGPPGGEDWSQPDTAPDGWVLISNGEINPTDWDASNAEVIDGAVLPTEAAWLNSRQFIDTVGISPSGSISRTFTGIGAGYFMVKFEYGRYVSVGAQTLTLTVTDNGPVSVPLSAPQAEPQIYVDSFVTSSPDLTITLAGTGINHQGPAIGTVWISHWT